ncbi:MAG: hypothetical protein ACW98F_03455 [Candidatus Hodarchaeales archaeon]|jgi:hypothetical protein
MSKRTKLTAAYESNSSPSVKKNPFHNIEKALQQLGTIYDKDWSIKNSILIPKPVIAHDSPPNKSKLNPNDKRIQTALIELRRMFTICQNCGRRTLNDELINDVCYICHNQKELSNVEKELKESKNNQQLLKLISRLGELETQMKSLENKQQKLTSKDYLSTVIEEISGTVRDSITSNLNQLTSRIPTASSPSSFKAVNPPPPPPPPGAISSSRHIPVPSANISHLQFAKLTFEELSAFSPQTLNSMSLDQRNKYTLRLKELQRLETMSPAEREAYLREKATFKQQHSDKQSVISSLEDLSNPLFKKMKEQADKTVLAGKGTFGFFAEKKVFVYCHNCNNTSQVVEGEEATCEMCNSPLNTR